MKISKTLVSIATGLMLSATVLAAVPEGADKVVARLDKMMPDIKPDSIAKAPRPFQGHQEVTLTGRWMQSRETIPAGSWIVHTGTSRDRLAMLLLEPESDDGMVTWNLLDAGLAVGQVAPVWRVSITRC